MPATRWSRTRKSRLRRSLLALASVLLLAPTGAAAHPSHAPDSLSRRPDPGGALQAAVQAPLRTLGDWIGGVGMLAATGLALSADLIHTLDHNRWTAPWLHGVASGALVRIAWGVSASSGAALELLRWEDIERLPEARATYLRAAPFVGRLDTALSGAAALRLGCGDAAFGVPIAVLRLAGLRGAADHLAQGRIEARIVALGPTALEPTLVTDPRAGDSAAPR